MARGGILILSLRRILICVLLGALLPASAQAMLPPKFGGILSVRLQDKISVIDPAMATRPDEFTVVFCLFETLLRPDGKGGVIPVLLDGKPQVSADGLTYYFKLEQEITFHDGSMLDPADVMHTIQRVAKSRRSPYSWLFDSIEGASAFRDGKARTISGFKIVDSLRFEIKLRKKNSAFLKYLTFPAAAIVPTNDRDFRPPIGTGPFKFLDMRAGGDITLTAFPGHHAGRPCLDGVKFKVLRNNNDALVKFKSGDVTITDVPMDGLSKEDAAAYGPPVSGPMKILWLLDLNPAKSPLNKPSGRGILAGAVDRNNIVKVVLNGNGRVENNTGLSGLSSKAADTPRALSLWYPGEGKALGFLADRLQHDLRRAGITVKPGAKKGGALYRFSADTAPDIVLRPLPVLLNLSESVDNTLYRKGHKSTFSTLALRIAGQEAANPAKNKYLAVYLFSQKTAYVALPGVQRLAVGAFNQLELDDMFLRKR